MSIGGTLSRLFGAGSSPDRRIPLDALAGWTIVVMEETAVWREHIERSKTNAKRYEGEEATLRGTVGDQAHCRGFCDPARREIVVRYDGLSATEPDSSVLWHELGHALGIMSHE